MRSHDDDTTPGEVPAGDPWGERGERFSPRWAGTARGPRRTRGGFGQGGGFGGVGAAGFGTGGFGFGGPPFGPGGPGGPGPFGHGRRGRGRARRGDVRHAVLAVLSDGEANGYSIIKSIAERTGGVWRTSPGSVYPTLAQLVDEGLIEAVEGAGSGTAYRLTEAGGTYVTDHAEELAAVWAPASQEWAEVGDMMLAGRKLMGVLRQVATDGTDEQRASAAAKMDDLRRELYRMLGE